MICAFRRLSTTTTHISAPSSYFKFTEPRYLSTSFQKMGKKSKRPSEEFLILPTHPSAPSAPIVDTHCHIASTFETYRDRYRSQDPKYATVFDFVRAMYQGKNVEAVVDVWCEAPVQAIWKEFADSALLKEDRERLWGGIEYWFVMGESHCMRWFFEKIISKVISRCPSVSLHYHLPM